MSPIHAILHAFEIDFRGSSDPFDAEAVVLILLSLFGVDLAFRYRALLFKTRGAKAEEQTKAALII